jgi:hypothetical protein
MAGIGSASRWSLVVAGLLVLGASAPADARKLTLAAEDVGYIESDWPGPEGRILVRFETPEALRVGQVEFAVLELRAAISADEGVSCVVVDAFPLTTEWNGATVGWDGMWSTPGGDYDRAEHAVWIARPGEDSVLRFDVTDMVSGWASGAMTNYGVVLAVSPGWPGALAASDAQGAETAVPTLLVYYTRPMDGER